MITYNKGANCDKLWRAWYGILITLLHVFLFYVCISRYLSFKSQAFDPKFGGNWDPAGLNFTLAMLISALTLFCLFLISNITRTSNYANEGAQIGRDTTNCHLTAPISDWRSAVPLLSTKMENGVAGPYNGGVGMTRLNGSQGHGGGSEDERVSNMIAGEEALPGPNYDTWSGRSGTNEDLAPNFMGINPYNCSVERKHLSMNKSIILLWCRFKRHFMPYANMLHLCTAYCLLVPIPIIHAQQIFHKALSTDWIWHSDMDVVFGTYSQSHSSDESIKPDVPAHLETAIYSTWDNLRAISPEFFNLILAYILVSLRYPSVFWYTNRTFSFVFSLLLFLAGLHALVEYNAACVLTKLVWNRDSIGFTLSLSSAPFMNSKMKVNTDRDRKILDQINQPDTSGLRDAIGPITLSLTSNIIFACVFQTVFEYGYLQFIHNLLSYRHYLVGHSNVPRCGAPITDLCPGNGERGASHLSNGNGPICNPSDSVNSGPNILNKSHCLGSPSIYRHYRSSRSGSDMLHPTCRPCLHNYAPHMACLIGTICLISMKLPLVWDCFRVYRLHKHPVMLAAPISAIIILCAWLITWFAFALKPAWKFQVNLSLPAVSGPLTPITPLPMFQLPTNGITTGPMVGSLLRTSSVMGNYGDNGSKLYAPYPSFASYPHSLPQASNPGQVDDASVQRSGIPSSPVYACYHDMPVNGCTLPNTRMIHLSANPNEIGGPIGNGLVSGTLVDARTADYGSVDTEVSSGRQSGNHYVCLQSALGPLKVGNNLPTTESFGPARYMFQNATSLPPSQLQTPTQYTMGFITNGVGSNSLYSPSSAMEEDRSSTNTVQPSNYRLKSLHPAEPGQNASLSGYALNNLDKYTPTFDTSRSIINESESSKYLKDPSSVTGGCNLDLPPHIFSADGSGAPRVKPIPPVVPRVAFRDNVDMIDHTSPNNNDQSSQNTSSNDSGIDNLRTERPATSTSSALDNSGTYDNAFIGLTCVDSRGVLNVSKNVTVESERLGIPMYNSIHATSPKSIGGSLMKESSSSESRDAGDALNELLTTAFQGRSDMEMIGDVNNSFQSSTATEPFSQFLPTDEQKEVRLCSQV